MFWERSGEAGSRPGSVTPLAREVVVERRAGQGDPNAAANPVAMLTALRYRLRWPHLAEWIAVAFLAMTAGAVETWLHSSSSDPWRAWMPNVAPSAFFVAVGILVVDVANRRRERKRLTPLLAMPYGHLHAELGRFLYGVAEDYMTTHAANVKPLPSDPLALLDLWLDEQNSADLEHVALGFDGEEETLREMGYAFAEQAERRERDLGELMEPALREALREVARMPAAIAFRRETTARTLPYMPPEMAAELDPERWSYRSFVVAARWLLLAMRRHARAPHLFKLDPAIVEWAQAARERRLAQVPAADAE